MLTCYAPVRRCPQGKPWFSLDLHVLGAPPAFVLSQDQTLHQDLDRTAGYPRGWSSIGELLRNLTEVEEQLNELTSLRPDRSGRFERLHWLLAFTVLFSRSKSPTYVEATRARIQDWVPKAAQIHTDCERWCQPVLPFRAREGNSGVRGGWSDYRDGPRESNTRRGPCKDAGQTLIYGSLRTPSTSTWFEIVGADMSQPSTVATPVTVTV